MTTYTTHFGCKLKGAPNELRLTRDNYLHKKKDGTYALRFKGTWSPGEIANHEQECLKNFDANMRFYESLDSDAFNRQIDLATYLCPGFMQIEDLSPYDHICGLYIMVLGEYKQLYVGKTGDSFRRRIKKHWTDYVEFDRLIMANASVSKLSIDCFRALDTTSIYVLPRKADGALEIIEEYLIEQLDQSYLANRIKGGELSWHNRLTPDMLDALKLRSL